MLTTNSLVVNAFKNPVRQIDIMVEVMEGNTVVDTIYNNTNLISFSLERVGEANKFFGFGVMNKANIKIRDVDRTSTLKAGDYLRIKTNPSNISLVFTPLLKITEIHRDEITNEMSITAYDTIYYAACHLTGEMDLEAPATIGNYAAVAAGVLGLNISYDLDNPVFDIEYEANIDGTETIRELLDAIAEATQTIYYITNRNVLKFRALDINGDAAYTIDKSQYISLDSGANRRLTALCHATELGDNVEAKLGINGTKQYIRNNAFLELREDLDVLLDAALASVGGMTINQFECEWRGNPAVEIGDKIALITKEDETVYSYMFDDIMTYDGSLSQKTQWKYENNDAESAENPTNLGEALKATFARVDKINREIELVASETEENSNSIAALEINTQSIAASVSEVKTNVNSSLDEIENEIETLTNLVNATMTAEGLQLIIQQALSNGVSSVYTTTGFSFDAEGLKIAKSGSEMESRLDEDGLSIFRDNTEVLTVNNQGVNGINMTVRQYLVVGGSRFEAYGYDRTGCFWVGGQ